MKDAGPAAEPLWVRRILSAPGLAFALLWGFGEGTLFFVVPDVLLTLAAIFRPRRALLHIAAATAGATLAGALMFIWASRTPASARAAVAHVPFVRESMFAHAQGELQSYGFRGLLLGPRYGIPYKVYAVEAPNLLSWPSFLAMTVPARLIRFALSSLFFAVLGFVLKNARLGRPATLAGIHAMLWIAFYACYWSKT